MNPYRLKNVFEYLTSNNQLLKRKLKLGTSEIPIPPKRQDVIDIEAINRFNKSNPRVDTTNVQPVVKPSTIKQSNVGEIDEGVIQGAFDTATMEARDGGYPAPVYEAFKKRYLKRNMKADGGRIGYNEGSKLTDFLDVQASGTKSGKQQIKGAPEGITSDKETLNAIVRLDVPISEKINLIGDLQYGKFRDKIEYNDNEIFLEDSKSYKDRNIGLDYNRGGEGLSGSVTVGDEGPEYEVRYKKSFADGGMLVQPNADGSRPGYSGRIYSQKKINELSDDLLKAYAEDDIIHIMDPKHKASLSDIRINRRGALDKAIKNTGLDKETIFNLLEDRDAFQDLELNEDVWKRGRKIDPDKDRFYKQAENWIVKNSKRYADPDKFKKAFIRTFGKNNDIIQKINRPDKKMLMRVPFSDWFRTNIMGSSDDSMRNQVKPSYSSNQLDNIFKTAIYTNNENVRNKIINELTNILPEKGSKRTPDIREKFKNSPILKKFNLNERIDGPIARLLAKEVGDDLLKQVSLFRKPFLGTTQLITYLKDRVNPKYKSMFEEAAKATTFAQKNSWPQARQALNSSNSIMFDHKIPKALIEAGYADEIEYIKLNPTSAEFNANIKRAEFDQPMIKLINEFERAKNLDGKAKVVEKMNTLKNNFSKKYGGYLDEVSITVDKTGKPIFKSSASPVTKKTDFVSSLGKSMVQAGEISEKDQVKLFKKMGYRCNKLGGGAEDVACYLDDAKQTRADLKSSDINVRAKAITKQRNALNVAKKLPEIGKVLRRVGQGTLAGVTGTLKALGFTSPIGYAIEGAVEGGIYDYYRKKGYNHEQSLAETFTPGIVTGRPEGVPWYGGAEKLLEKELSEVREKPTILEDGTIVPGKVIEGKVSDPKILQYQQALKDQEQFYDAFGRKVKYQNLQGTDQGTYKKLASDASADIQDLYRSGTVSNINRIMNPESMASQAYNTAVERQLGLQDERARDYKAKNYAQKEPSEFMQEQKLKDRNKAMLEMFPMYTQEEADNMYKKFKIEKPENFNIDIFNNVMRDQDKTNYFADNFRLEKASGGIASLTKTIPPESGPTPHGLRYPYNNVKKIKE